MEMLRRPSCSASDSAGAKPRSCCTATRAICAPPSKPPSATMIEHTGSAMARETAEIPTAAERLLARHDVFTEIAERIERAKPRIVVFCGRGSSGHVGVYLRYLFEVRLGLLASASAPSVVTAYQ